MGVFPSQEIGEPVSSAFPRDERDFSRRLSLHSRIHAHAPCAPVVLCSRPSFTLYWGLRRPSLGTNILGRTAYRHATLYAGPIRFNSIFFSLLTSFLLSSHSHSHFYPLPLFDPVSPSSAIDSQTSWKGCFWILDWDSGDVNDDSHDSCVWRGF